MKSLADRATPRFFAAMRLSPGAEIELPERASRHCSVLRLREGDPITLFNGEGGEHAAELTRISRDAVRARVTATRAIERESSLAVTLAQCVSGGDRMDIAVQKATELGAVRIVPIASERSVVKLSSERADRRVAHWRNVVIAACEQCGRNRIPDVAAIVDLRTFVSTAAGSDESRLVLAPDVSQDLKRIKPPRAVTLLIGPEGGLAPEERRSAEEAGFVPVSFGPRVLRTETAPLAAIAAMQAMWGDC